MLSSLASVNNSSASAPSFFVGDPRISLLVPETRKLHRFQLYTLESQTGILIKFDILLGPAISVTEDVSHHSAAACVTHYKSIAIFQSSILTHGSTIQCGRLGLAD